MSRSADRFSSLYPDEHFDARREPQTYWHATGGAPPVAVDPLVDEARADVAIIGGGVTGLSAALHLARDHGLSVRLLEAGSIGFGASGRSGGFCCLGGARRDWTEIARRFGTGAAGRWFEAEKRAIALVEELAELHRIDLRRCGGGELILAHRPGRFGMLQAEAAAVAELFGEQWELLLPEELAERGIRVAGTHGALFIPYGFGLHPLRYVRGLARAAVEQGARIHEHSAVRAWEHDGGRHRLHTEGGSVSAERVLLATNGYTPEWLLPAAAGRLLPVLSAILVTRPLTLAEREAQGWTVPALLSDTRELLFYMRMLPDQRLLFGARGGLRGTEGEFERRIGWMQRQLHGFFPAWRHVGVEHAWWGLVAMARDGVPHLAPLPELPDAWFAGAYHGNGMAMGTWLGAVAAARLAGVRFDGPLPEFVERAPPRFPLPGMRLLYLALAQLWFGARDRWF